MKFHEKNDGYKCTKVDAGELLKQAVRKMTRPREKKKDRQSGRTVKVQAGSLLRKVQALDKLVKAGEDAGEKHVEYGTAKSCALFFLYKNLVYKNIRLRLAQNLRTL